MTRLALLLCALVACGGSIDPPTPADASPDAATADDGALDADAVPPFVDAQADATQDADASCWRCVPPGSIYMNLCTDPPTRAPDAESCLHCGEHCDGGP